MEYRAVDRVVHADMEVIRVRAELLRVKVGNAAEILLFRGCHHFAIAKSRGFLIRFCGELAGEHIVGLAVFRHQIQRHHRKLRGCAALQKEHLVVIRDLHHLAQKAFRALDDRVIDLRSV